MFLRYYQNDQGQRVYTFAVRIKSDISIMIKTEMQLKALTLPGSHPMTHTRNKEFNAKSDSTCC